MVEQRAGAVGSDPFPMFPPWARYVEAAIPVSLAVAVSIQHDALFPPDWADRLNDYFTEVRLHVADGGHFTPLECPDQFAELILVQQPT